MAIVAITRMVSLVKFTKDGQKASLCFNGPIWVMRGDRGAVHLQSFWSLPSCSPGKDILAQQLLGEIKMWVSCEPHWQQSVLPELDLLGNVESEGKQVQRGRICLTK